MSQLVDDILHGKTKLREEEVWELTGMLQDRYRSEKNVVETDMTSLVFVGDLHGEYDCLQGVQKLIRDYDNHLFTFLGDYGDRGPLQVETFNLVAALALKYPERVMMLRGNHETASVATRYGFYSQIVKAYGHSAFRHYTTAFSVLPMALRTEHGIFACHGGVPEGATSVGEINACSRYGEELDDEILYQIAWNDPQEGDFRFRPNPRGGSSRIFGEKAFGEFAECVGFETMIRAHEVVPSGVKSFFSDRLQSIFSASYGGRVKPKALRVGPQRKLQPLSLL